MLPFIALAAVAAMVLLVFRPVWGIAALFVVRPLVDTTFEHQVFAGLKLTEIFSGGVPLLILAMLLLGREGGNALRNLPLKTIWLLWFADVFCFSLAIMAGEDLLMGINVLLRHANGFVGYCMIQTFCNSEKDTRRFVWALVVAGLFPIGTGIYEAITGFHWSIAAGADNRLRNVGMYHDAITMRYYALQTIMGLLLLSGLYLKRKHAASLVALLYGIATCLVVQKTYSKSGTLTLAVWVVLWPLLLRKYRTVAAMAIAGLAVAAWYADVVMDTFGFVFARELSVISDGAAVETSFAGRWQIWYALMERWDHLSVVQKVFGAGFSAPGAHNDYLQILFHGGFVGVGIYVALLLLTGIKLVRNVMARGDAFTVAGVLAYIMWVVDTIGLVPSIYPGYQWFVWGVIGLSLRKAATTQPQAESATEATPEPRQLDRIPRFEPGTARGGLMS